MKQTDKKADLISESYKNYCENFDEGNFSKKWLKLEESFDGFFNDENYSCSSLARLIPLSQLCSTIS